LNMLRGQPNLKLRLPELDLATLPGWQFVRHAVSLVMVLLGVLASLGAFAAFTMPIERQAVGLGTLEPDILRVPNMWTASVVIDRRDIGGVSVSDWATLEWASDVSADLKPMRGTVSTIEPIRRGVESVKRATSDPVGLYRVRITIDGYVARRSRAQPVRARIIADSATVVQLLRRTLRERLRQ
jgi:hypothetical protein